MNVFPGNRFGPCMAAAVLVTSCLAFGGFAAAQKPLEVRKGAVIRIEGLLTPRVEQFMYRKLAAARKEGVNLVVLEIESPGGYLATSQNMGEFLRDKVTWARTVAFIPKQALSGAAILALGCDEILIARNALIGDAGAIYEDEFGMYQHAEEKVVSNLAEWVRLMAESNGHPPELAEAMVDRNKIVYRATHVQTGETRIADSHAVAPLREQPEWTVEEVRESQAGRFLELSGARAVELGLAKENVAARVELRTKLNLDHDPTVYEETWIDRTVYVLNWPLVTGLLLVIGLIAIYIELSAPGIGIGGLIGCLCFAIFFWSRFLGGTSGWLEVILFLAGIAFLAVEFFIIPGWGVAGITGLLLLVVSVVMAGQTFTIPETSRQFSILGNSLLVLLGSGISFVVIAILLSRHLGSLPLFGRLVLQTPAQIDATAREADNAEKPASAAAQGHLAVGDWGTATTPLRPAGIVSFGEDLVDVVTEGGYIETGRQVRVIQMRGNRVVVREVDA